MNTNTIGVMKKIIFTLLGLLMITSASAQESGFIPVLSEGKSWEVATIKTSNYNDTTGYYNVYVGDDTIVNNLACKKIEIVPKDNLHQAKTNVAYEEDGKVWYVKDSGEMQLIYDIGLKVNDMISGYYYRCYVVYEGLVRVKGDFRKRLVIDTGFENVGYYFYFVEGVGISSDIGYYPRLGIGDDSEYTCMLSCSDNGETIFTQEDFEKENVYVPLVREGVVWEYVGHYQKYWEDEEQSADDIMLYTLQFNGTTDFTDDDGQTMTYHNLYRTDYDKCCVPQVPYLAAYVREEDKVVTAKESDNNYWWFLPDEVYNFRRSSFMPEQAFLYYPFVDMRNCKVFDVVIGNTIRKCFHDNYNDGKDYSPDAEVKIIEGIGVDCMYGDLLIPYRTFITGINPIASLSAVYENDELVYKGFAYDEAQQLKNPDAINIVDVDKQVAGVHYYNLAGVESSEPQQGVNIRVTTFTDGSRRTDKIIR